MFIVYNVWSGKFLGAEGWFNSSRKDAKKFVGVTYDPEVPAETVSPFPGEGRWFVVIDRHREINTRVHRVKE